MHQQRALHMACAKLKNHLRRLWCGALEDWSGSNNTTNSLPTSTWYFCSDPKIYIFGFLLFFLASQFGLRIFWLPLFCLASVHISCKVRNSVFTCDFSLNDSIMHRFFDIFFFMRFGGPGHGWARVMKVMSFVRIVLTIHFFGAFSHQIYNAINFPHWPENGTTRIVWSAYENHFFFLVVIFVLSHILCDSHCVDDVRANIWKSVEKKTPELRSIIWRINKLSGFVKCINARQMEKKWQRNDVWVVAVSRWSWSSGRRARAWIHLAIWELRLSRCSFSSVFRF